MTITRNHPRRSRPGFTLVEMLITVAIIIVLLTMLAAALVGVGRGGQKVRTQYLMSSISKALVRFESDLGYLPPVLDMKRNVMLPPALPSTASGVTPQAFAANVQKWYSHTSLAEFLMGYGDRSADGYGFIGAPGTLPPTPAAAGGEQEFPGQGIRNPGEDGCWGALIDPRPGTPGGGFFISRNLPPSSGSGVNSFTNRYTQGKVYGPYLELKDERLIGAISLDTNGNPILNNSEPVIVFPGEVDNFDELPKVIVDYWGRPIRYYRTLYPAPLLKAAHKNAPANLGDVVALRPTSFAQGTDTDASLVNGNPAIFADQKGDRSTSRLLQAARYALFSSGPDKRLNRLVRADNEELNKDNIVETGP